MHPKKSITIEAVSAVYFLVLGLVATFNMLFPLQTTATISLVLPAELINISHPYIRYRVALFLSANIVLIVLAIVLYLRGFENPDKTAVKRMSWWLVFVANIIGIVCWLGFPMLAMAQQTHMGNDIFYFFTTVFFFLGIQLFLQFTIYKLRLSLARQ